LGVPGYGERPFDAFLRGGDLLVLNDAGTIPASLPAHLRGAPVELRLVAPPDGNLAQVLLFGAGDFRTRTEDRPAPPALRPGDRLALSEASARVVHQDPTFPRLLIVAFDRPAMHVAYAEGRPVQYAYVCEPLQLWDVQTPIASRPWAVEAPSASYLLDLPMLRRLRGRGVEIATLTHAAGLSSTGDPALDARLPFPERYALPEATAVAVRRALVAGRRVVALGTTVARALEGNAASFGRTRAGEYETDLRLGPASELRVVSAIYTGVHEEGVSHFGLLEAFRPAEELRWALRESERRGFLTHEFGDAWFVERAAGRAA
jgi:S-adenosylmethionine:tRNA ribosyltransferase-isomerase